MKTLANSLIGILLITLTACGGNEAPSAQKGGRDTVPAGRQFQKPANRFAGVQFAIPRDTSCGMPLSAGLEDTLHLHGKIYGFCSKECKDNFIAKLQTDHKR